ncbi:DUF4260 domain-containing protein [Thiomicrorhabdus xiamenensis]|uniref:DUF4260 domain-containing protein n=1 Tax=Thiomicrorhabdus xiamenensis TaxID=2739063 RepID=A0A7D4NNU6_9GAMM|nr:DUF4260 domain-containing protein [Thiomicrorhabdus xiamenensis]QKI89053.1 DUF4260 domain-containing protein [Thiomicrorhabdus xiamenensis]
MSFVTGNLRTVLRLEGLSILLLSALIFHQYSADWILFAWLFLVPDLAFLGYVFNSKFGAILYNTTHSMIGPALLLASGLLSDADLAISMALICFAHIGFDRALGYGLKYGSGFTDTHLGKIGSKRDT